MKKLSAVVLMAAFGLSLSFASCQKKQDYTCSCTVLGQNISAVYTNVKKKDAQKSCDGVQAGFRTNGDPDATCNIK